MRKETTGEREITFICSEFGNFKLMASGGRKEEVKCQWTENYDERSFGRHSKMIYRLTRNNSIKVKKSMEIG
jgi:hypothetical protein